MSKKESKPTLEQLKQERNILIISNEDPERLQYLKATIDYIEYGIK